MIRKFEIDLNSLIIIFFILWLPIAVKGQQPDLINPELLKNRWEARWITCPGVSLTDFGVYHFRKSFQLKNQPEKFIIHVSGDNRYRLFVNGKEVCNGPARGDLAHWHFETIDIAEKLKAGKNVLSAVVWNFGEYQPLAQMSLKTAFIVQGNGDAEAIVNTEDSWKVIKNAAYQSPAARPPRTVVGPGEIVYSEKYPYGWEKVDFDDASWLKARVLSRGTPDGQFTSWDWNLIPRKIPFMEYKFQRIAEVERTENIEVDNRFPAGDAPVVIPRNREVKILLDQIYLTTAYPELIVSGGKGASIKIDYAEAMADANGIKGNRNETDDKTMLSYYSDLFWPDGTQNRHYQPLWFRTYRYMELTVKTADDPLTIHDLYGYFTAYPFEEKARFKSDNPNLQKIWDVGWRTARLCAGETYYDCPYYEQLQYVGDTRIQALISLYVAEDDRLMRNAIEQFHHSLLPMGLTQSRYPSQQPQVIPPFSLIWIYMVHDYWMHRDDAAFVEQQLNGVRNVLHWYEQQIAENGMLGPMDWWNFVDWSFGPFNGLVPIGGTPNGARDGNSSIITLQYVDALQKASELFWNFGDNALAAHYNKLSASLIQKTAALCRDSEKGLIADTPEKETFSQHANMLAILTGMVKGEESTELFHRMLASEEITEATFYFKYYFFRAMNKAGLGNEYIRFLEPWSDMLDIGLTTFAEKPEPTRSDCHAWSAHPNYDMLATICGITPASPGFKTVRIAPHLGRLKFIEGTMPHPKGNISVDLKKVGESELQGEIVLPEGLTGQFIWNGKTVTLSDGKKKIQLN